MLLRIRMRILVRLKTTTPFLSRHWRPNVRFDEIGDSDASQLAKLNAYQVVVVPLLVDLPPDVASALTEFQRSGGKLLITDSGGTPQAGAQALEQAIGVAVAGHSTATEKLSLSSAPGTIAGDRRIRRRISVSCSHLSTVGDVTGRLAGYLG